MSAQLYRHFDAAGALLYVGCSGNVIRRTGQHELQSPWFPKVTTITIEHFAEGLDALAAEAFAVRSERPKHNVQGRAPDLHQTAIEREEWNAAELADGKRRAADMLAAKPFTTYFDNSDLAKAGLKIGIALLQSGMVRKRKFGKRVVYSRSDIEALATAPSETWVISAPRIQTAA